jgi:hypothetical protein
MRETGRQKLPSENPWHSYLRRGKNWEMTNISQLIDNINDGTPVRLAIKSHCT